MENKSVISRETISRIKHINRKQFTTEEQLHLDLFLCGYYLNGISLKDLVKLKNSDIIDAGRNHKLRHPIEDCNILEADAIAIMMHYRNDIPEEYLFPVLRNVMEYKHSVLIKKLDKKISRTLRKVETIINCQRLSWDGLRLAYVNNLIDKFGYTSHVASFSKKEMLKVAQERYEQGLDRISKAQMEEIFS